MLTQAHHVNLMHHKYAELCVDNAFVASYFGQNAQVAMHAELNACVGHTCMHATFHLRPLPCLHQLPTTIVHWSAMCDQAHLLDKVLESLCLGCCFSCCLTASTFSLLPTTGHIGRELQDGTDIQLS